jgi:hypothetical protein
MYIQDVRKRKVIPTMPNWVMNELTCVFQSEEEYNAFKEKAKTEALYNSFFPMPSILEGTSSPHLAPGDYINEVNKHKNTNFLTLEEVATCDDEWVVHRAKEIIQNIKAFEQTGYHDWYSWNLDNWGVKWDASNCKSKELSDFNTIIFEFDSPWGTPEHFVRELSKLFPNATFEMVSGSIENDSHYEFTCEDGKFVETCSYETFKDAVLDGKWGGAKEWEMLFEDEQV